VARNTSGTPLVSDLFKQAEQSGTRNLFGYVNSDILLMSDFMQALRRVSERKRRFLLVGHRWNLVVSKPLDFGPEWETTLRREVGTHGTLAGPTSIDLFAFPRGVFGEVPPFAIGRPHWDNWMLYRACALRIPIVDATPVAMAVHQNHDYSHHPQGLEGTRTGNEALANAALAGDAPFLFTLVDATYVLTPHKLRFARDRDHLLRRCETLPVSYPFPPLTWANTLVSMSRPLRSRFGLTLNAMLQKPKD
jgi:hypothetical protein